MPIYFSVEPQTRRNVGNRKEETVMKRLRKEVCLPFMASNEFPQDYVDRYYLPTLFPYASADGDDMNVAYQRGVALGTSGQQTENPYAEGTAEAKAFEQGYVDGQKIFRRLAAGNITSKP